MLITLLFMILIVTGMFFCGASFIVIVTLPVSAVVLPLLDIFETTRSDIECMCIPVPSSLTIPNLAINFTSGAVVVLLCGGLIHAFQIPDAIHAGWPLS